MAVQLVTGKSLCTFGKTLEGPAAEARALVWFSPFFSFPRDFTILRELGAFALLPCLTPQLKLVNFTGCTWEEILLDIQCGAFHAQ